MVNFIYDFKNIAMKKIILLLLLSILFTGCRTKKVALEKQEQSVSEIVLNDIKKTETEIKEIATIQKIEFNKFTLTPVDSQKPSKVIINQDTIQYQNSVLNFDNSKEEKISLEKSKTNKSATDKSTADKNQSSKSKILNKDITSASWGLNIGIILGILLLLILLYIAWKFRR